MNVMKARRKMWLASGVLAGSLVLAACGAQGAGTFSAPAEGAVRALTFVRTWTGSAAVHLPDWMAKPLAKAMGAQMATQAGTMAQTGAAAAYGCDDNH